MIRQMLYFYTITIDMQVKIYVNEKPVWLTDKLNGELRELSENKSVLMYDDASAANVADLQKELAKDAFTAAIISGKSIAKLKQDLFGQFTVIEAAGGIVQNEKKDILFIYRREKWDLPKGKLDKGEDAETCATREIEEETGVKKLTLKRKAGETIHVYREKGKDILKISHWFYFTCSSKQELHPQIEEDITEVKWVPTQNIREPMENTYRNIRDIMSSFFDTP